MMKAFMLLGDLSTKQGEELSDMAVKYQEKIAFATMRAVSYTHLTLPTILRV